MDTFKEDLSKSQNSKLMKQRTLWAILTTLARPCTVTETNGSTHSGIIHTFCKKGIILYTKPGQVKILIEKIVSMQCCGIQTISKNKFKTDQEISKQRRVQKRTLQHWEGEEPASLNFDIKDYKAWDQFEINKQKFGVVSTYDENLYTTPVPRLSELTEDQLLRAKLVEKELGVNSLEKEENELDEEAQFGAVLGSGRYENARKEKVKKGKKKADENKAEATGKKFVNSKKSAQNGQSFEMGLGKSEEPKNLCVSVVGHYVDGWSKFFKKN